MFVVDKEYVRNDNIHQASDTIKDLLFLPTALLVFSVVCMTGFTTVLYILCYANLFRISIGPP